MPSKESTGLDYFVLHCFFCLFFRPETVLKPHSCRGATRHDNSQTANTARNIGRKGIHRTVIISWAMIVFIVNMTRQHSVVGQQQCQRTQICCKNWFFPGDRSILKQKVESEGCQTWDLGTCDGDGQVELPVPER